MFTFTWFTFAIAWAGLLATTASELSPFTVALLVAYPVFDLGAAVHDLRSSGAVRQRVPLVVNMALSLATTIGLVVAIGSGIPDVLRVWGFWAVATGVVQLIVAARRRGLGGQWPLILSGGISVLAGASFVASASGDDASLAGLAGYAALGGIHSAYRVVPGRFKDWISTPKTNGYQSLHTGVTVPERRNAKIEVQIRTREMHEIAEFGVAAHWIYKQGEPGGTTRKRYPWVRYYTPINEIYVTARMSAKDGAWNEQLRTDKGFVTAMKHLVAASIMATQQIAGQRPDCIIVQSESAEYIHELKASPCAQIKLDNKLRFLALDLLYAHHPDAEDDPGQRPVHHQVGAGGEEHADEVDEGEVHGVRSAPARVRRGRTVASAPRWVSTLSTTPRTRK